MKKYWKISLLIAVVVLTVGSFYTHSAYSSTQLPQFYIKKDSGDSSILKKVTFSGDYLVGSINQGVTVEHNKTTYDTEKSFIEQFDREFAHRDPAIKQLQKEYRNFMRGKYNTEAFYEDNQLLSYADILNATTNSGSRSFVFKISVLNKKTNNSTSFDYAIPNPDQYNHVYVEDVQYFGKELKVLTRSYLQDTELDGEELDVYTFDIPNKKLLSKDEVKGHSKNGMVYTRLPGVDPLKPNKYAVYSISERELENEEGTEPPKPKEKELVVYDLGKNQKVDINFPKDILKMNLDALPAFVDGSTIYFTEEKNNAVRLKVFNIDTRELENEITLPVEKHSDSREIQSMIKNGKLYLLIKYNKMQNAEIKIMIADIKTEKMVYSGTLMTDKSQSIRSLQLYNILVK
ncbi:hypothetical protein [Peribacillus deserti]|uniref:Uncharacterized protein n=1 Tax=Peribacillus deserti TaxID=673318 RepID=A0A2N5M5G4_9BACI|nr:hypothetical protein [Peribacillus deserti]PLT29606.1 hypothetical protein CUU66_11910 [Peribacillus deserti]